MTKHRTSHRRWRQTRQEILAESDICWLCGHEGSDSVDHILAVTLGGTDDRENLAPAHLKACPTCGVKCNLVKGAKAQTGPAVQINSRQWF